MTREVDRKLNNWCVGYNASVPPEPARKKHGDLYVPLCVFRHYPRRALRAAVPSDCRLLNPDQTPAPEPRETGLVARRWGPNETPVWTELGPYLSLAGLLNGGIQLLVPLLPAGRHVPGDVSRLPLPSVTIRSAWISGVTGHRTAHTVTGRRTRSPECHQPRAGVTSRLLSRDGVP